MPPAEWQTQAPAEVFSYPPLPHARCIRLIRFEDSSSLCISVHAFDIDRQAPAYDALSYTWDAPFCTDACLQDYAQTVALAVITDGRSSVLHVKRNLHEALQQLHCSQRDRWFWADAICINQADLQERESQVLLMGQLYRQARRVVAWIGRSDEHTDDIRWLHTELWDRLQEQYRSRSDYVDILNGPMSNAILVNDLGVDDPGTRWQSLYRFYRQCRYFTRAWILQELVLAREVVFFYGDAELTWDSLVFLNEFSRLSDFSANIHRFEDGEERAGTGSTVELEWLWRLRQSHIDGGPESTQTSAQMDRVYGACTVEQRAWAYFEWIVAYSRRFDTSVPHDKICAVLGIISLYWQSPEPLILPDYSASPASFYTKVAERVLRVAPCLTLLSLVEDPSRRRLSGLPSWVPDFSANVYVEVSSTWFLERLDCLAGLQMDRFRAVEDRKLHVQAVKIGQAVEVSRLVGLEAGDPDESGFIRMNDLVPFLRSQLRFLSALDPGYMNGQKPLDAVVGAMYFNVLGKGEDRLAPMFLIVLQAALGRGLYLSSADDPEEPWDDEAQAALEEAMQLLERLNEVRLPQQKELDAFCDMFRTSPEVRSTESAEKFDAWAQAFSLFGKTIGRMQHSRRSFLMDSKLLGLGPRSTGVGDEVWLIHEGRVPYVLRPCKDGSYALIGEVYVHGVMQGELVDSLPVSKFQKITIL